MASLGSYLPPPGSAVWRRDVASSDFTAQEGKRVRHVVIRDAQIWTTPAPFVVYRVDVLTEHDHWYMYKRYSQFYSLNSKLVKKYGTKVQLPPKKLSGNLSKALIDKRRQSLETYLQKLVHGESQVALSPELMSFLDVPTHDVIEVTDILTRHLYSHGDQLLEEATPISLSVNEMYAITKRLLFPRDAAGQESADVAADPGHLYSFVHQLQSLKITLPPSDTSVCCSNFEIAHFKSLDTLKMDKVPLSQAAGMVAIQQQLKKLSVHRGLHTLRELLIEAVEEKRGSSHSNLTQSLTNSPRDTWRISATAKLTTSRVIVQPWLSLHTLTLSHNLLTHLDDSLQLLPVLRELILSHNQIQELHLRFLCLPSLEKLSIAHNSITTIHTDKKVLERITYLNLSHNRLQNLNWLNSFVGVGFLVLSYNLISQRLDLDKLTQLRMLNTLSLSGNPIMSSSSCRLIVLAKFSSKARKVVLDGQEATTKEQAKLAAYSKKHGADPDLWPIAKSLSYIESSAGSHLTPPNTPTAAHSTPDLEVSWQVQSSLDSKPHPLKTRSSSLPPTAPGPLERSPVHGSFDNIPSPHIGHSHTPTLLSQSLVTRRLRPGDERNSTGGSASSLRNGSLVSLASREEPDGQSDVSSVSPEQGLNFTSERSSVSLLTPPPSTPQTKSENLSLSTISPAMIRSALESLQLLQNKESTQSPPSEGTGQGQICPEAVANALSVLMKQESRDVPTPPPSTPLAEGSDTTNIISSADLITALSALAAPSRHSSVSGESSAVCSVPASTPNEDRQEWLKLGFKPEDVIQALTKLSLQREELDNHLEDGTLSPIQEEQSSLGSKNNTLLFKGVRDIRSASQSSFGGEPDYGSPAPPDFVFSPQELGESDEMSNTPLQSTLMDSCSPSDNVLYS